VKRLRILLWPTTMQGDIYALAHYLQGRVRAGDALDVVVAVDDEAAYRREPIHALVPFELPLWERSAWRFYAKAKAFAPDFFVTDNHLPKRRVFENLVCLWHGFGWKEQRADIEFRSVHAELDELIGGVRQPNPNFVHQCYGRFEKEHRVAFTQFAPENCRVMGNLYADMLLAPPVSREAIAPYYPFRGARRKTVLLGFTWGFGEVFAHWGVDESAFIRKLLDFLVERDCNVIFRLHDRSRYDAKYLRTIDAVARSYPNVLLKFKDVGRDNLLDVLMSDVIVSNFSGIVVYAYFTGVPSVHIHPFGETEGDMPLLRFKRGRAVVDDGASYVWKMPAEDNGGLLAKNPDALFRHLATALDDPSSCREASARFNASYMENSDGARCAALYRYLKQWHETGAKPAE
jgi:hypothetical protein